MATATLLPLPRAVFYDAIGNPLVGGLVSTFVPGGSTPKTTWQDAAEATPNTNPIVLDSAGSCLIYGSGTYQLTVTDSNGNAVPGYSGITTVALSTINFSTIATLRLNNTSVAAPAAVYVVGYAANADGGEGWFVYNPSSGAADNGGTIIVDAFGNHWYRDTSGNPAYVEMFGAKGDGATDDSAAINAALSSCAAVSFTPGKIYAIASRLAVPVSCLAIFGTGATVVGPGTNVMGGTPGVTVDGFVYLNWYTGGGTIVPVDSYHRLPSVKNCRRAVSMTNVSWANVYIEYIQFCTSGIYMDAPGAGLASYCVENKVYAGTLEFCTNGIDLNTTSSSALGYQGNRFFVFYMAANTIAIKGTFGSADAGIFINNEFQFTVCDGNGGVGTPIVMQQDFVAGGSNRISIPGGIVGYASSIALFKNVGPNTVIDALDFQGTDPAPMGWDNFVAQGPRTRLSSGLNIFCHVSNAGSDTTGDGSVGNPYATIQTAIGHIQNLDMMDSQIVIQLAPGTYPGAAVYNAIGGSDCRGQLTIAGDTGNAPAYNITGGVTASGPNAYIFLEGLTIATNGLQSANGADIVIGPSIIFGVVTGTQIFADAHGRIQLSNSYTIAGGATIHMYADDLGLITVGSNVTVQLNDTPAFTEFAAAARCGVCDLNSISFAGTGATGVRYVVSLNGVIDTNTGNTSYLPGSSPGTTATGGQYN